MSIEKPPEVNGCAFVIGHMIVYGLLALGFYKLLELVTAPFL